MPEFVASGINIASVTPYFNYSIIYFEVFRNQKKNEGNENRIRDRNIGPFSQNRYIWFFDIKQG